MSKKTSKRIFQICHICAYILPILSCLVGVGLLIYYPLLGFRFQLVALVLVLLAIFLVAMQLAYRKHKRVVLYVFMVQCALWSRHHLLRLHFLSGRPYHVHDFNSGGRYCLSRSLYA